MKKLLFFLPILFLQSCSFQQDKAALDCEITGGTGTEEDIKMNNKDHFVLVVDYKKESLTLVMDDISWKALNPSLNLKKITFQNPLLTDPNKPMPGNFIYIDRKTLKISGTNEYPYFGFCKKTNLPDLSGGSGKQI